MKGADVVYKAINRYVNKSFIYSGGAIMPLIDKFYQTKHKYYINSNEHCSALSAVGYAKSSGNTGLCIVTSGPGLTNTITGITDAMNDSTPMVVLSGQVSTSALGSCAFQEAPSIELTKPVTKWSYQPKKASELESVMNKAFILAKHGKPGVVHIDLCKDILIGDATGPLIPYIIDKSPEPKNNCDIEEVAHLINQAKRPVLIIGKGSVRYSEEVRNFCKSANIPATSTIHAMGVVDETSYHALQFLGMHGNVAANYAVQDSDCIINLGSRFDDRITGNTAKFAPRAKIIHCNIESSDINKNIKVDHAYVGDVGDFLSKLNPYLKFRLRDSWFQVINEWKTRHCFKYVRLDNCIKQQEVIYALDYYIDKKNTIITTGVGNHQMYACQFIHWTHPRRFITSGSLGVMGAGLPYAIGAQIANPDKTVIVIDGDGSFNMTLTDLRTIVQYQLPIKIIVLDDGHLSMVRVWEKLFYNERYVATDLPNNPNYYTLAKSFGMDALYCDNRLTLPRLLRTLVNHNGPILLHCKVKTDNCFPLVPPGCALNELLLHPTTDMSSDLPPS